MGKTVQARGYAVQGSCEVGVVIWEQYFYGDRGHAKLIEGLYHRVVRIFVGMTEWRTIGVDWEWPLVDGALETAGMWPIKGYIQRRQASVASQVSLRPIYELFMVS